MRLENGNVGTYSTRVLIGMGGPPYIELLDAVPGTFFNATPSRPVVEIAYVVGTPQNLIDASQLLTNAGMPLVGTIATEPHHEPQPNGRARRAASDAELSRWRR